MTSTIHDSSWIAILIEDGTTPWIPQHQRRCFSVVINPTVYFILNLPKNCPTFGDSL